MRIDDRGCLCNSYFPNVSSETIFALPPIMFLHDGAGISIPVESTLWLI
jgi:hypothetical protein